MFPDDVYDFHHDSPSIEPTTSSRLFRVVRRSTGEELVLKAPLEGDEQRRNSRFQREIEALKEFAGPGTMPVVEHAEDFSWYVMPVAVRTLADTPIPASLEDARQVLEIIEAALRRAHERGQVHRDLKPENILLLRDDSGDRWVVSDFGIVRNASGATSQQLTQVGGLTGTEHWAAPEQYRDAHAVEPQADVYSAAVVLAWMLTGVKPVHGQIDVPDHSPVAGILDRAMRPRPRDRYQTMKAFLDDFVAAMDDDMPSLDRVLADGRYRDVPRYLGRFGDEWPTALDLLPRLRRTSVDDWVAGDGSGLVSTVVLISDRLEDDPGRVDDRTASAFTTFVVGVLSSLLDRGDDRALELADPVLGLLRGRNDVSAADALLDPLDRAGVPLQESFWRRVLSSGARDLLAQAAAERTDPAWTSRRLAELRDTGRHIVGG